MKKSEAKKQFGEYTSEPVPFSKLLKHIEDELDFATSHYNTDYVKRRIDSRKRRVKKNTYKEYYHYLLNTPSESEHLLNSFNINVTQFFRNEEVWDEIQNILVSLTERTDGDINIWSAGCADGREPYSLSMIALDNKNIDETRINILATDINDESLQTAAEGHYKQTPTINIEEQLSYLSNPEKYVVSDETGYRVDENVKQLVTFEKHDIIREPPKENMDLIVCRNLFIYIQRAYELEIIDRIAEALNDDGYFIVGKAETVPSNNGSSFNIVDTRLRVYQKA